MRPALIRSMCVALGVLLVPHAGAAQIGSAGVNGVVKDPSGLVIPGATVEVTNPATNEVRSAVTDGEGQYRVSDLRPGTYSVTCSLTGFGTTKRAGIELPPNFAATINFELKVGDLQETVTVVAGTPLVDITNVTQQVTISQRQLATVPTAKTILAFASLMAAAASAPSAQDVGGSKGEQTARISVHGGHYTDAVLMLDGMSYNRVSAAYGRSFMINPLEASQVTIEVAGGGSAEYTTSGAVINVIPKDGGNRFTGTMFAAATNHDLQANNLTSDLQAQGLHSINGIREIYDLNAVFGGPLIKDQLWFATSQRLWGHSERIANLFHDANLFQRVPSAPAAIWKFAPDLGQPVDAAEDFKAITTRVTWQATRKHKFTFSYDYEHNNQADNFTTLSTGQFSEDSAQPYCWHEKLFQSTWTYPRTNSLLLEAGFTAIDESSDQFENFCVGSPTRLPITDTAQNFTYNGFGQQSWGVGRPSTLRFSTSYIAGAHSLKMGWSSIQSLKYDGYNVHSLLSYTFNNGVPTGITEWLTPRATPNNQVRPALGLFAQDSWRLNRLTLNMGLRYEYLRAYAPAHTQPATALSPATSFPFTDCLPCWHDVNPRLGGVYDLFGNGRTALKASVGRYVNLVNIDLANLYAPSFGVVTSTTRSWNDRNGDFIPDCDLVNPLTNGECGPLANQALGQLRPTTVADPNYITGFGKRPYSWTSSISVDHELRPGMAVNVGYYHTWFGNFTVVHNQFVTPADYDPYCMTVATDARLGSVSGSQICGLYDINPSKFGRIDNVATLASNYGKYTEVYDGGDINFQARLARGINLSGGWNIGNAISVLVAFPGVTNSRLNRCFVVDSPQELYHCASENPYQSRFKVNGSVPLPWDLQAAFVYQNLPGPNYGALLTVPTETVAQSLGRPLAGGVRTVTIDLLPTYGSFLDERIEQLDVRLTKMLQMGQSRKLQVNLDLYNALNASPVLQVIQAYGPNWLHPTNVLPGRLFKFGVQFDF